MSVGNGRTEGKGVCQVGLPNGVKDVMRRSPRLTPYICTHARFSAHTLSKISPMEWVFRCFDESASSLVRLQSFWIVLPLTFLERVTPLLGGFRSSEEVISSAF
jgi:hypothetical protein